VITFIFKDLFIWLCQFLLEIGYFLSAFLATSTAGKYEAISGFCFSLIKQILVVRFSTYFPGYFDGQNCLWWVFLVLGFLLFLRGFVNYAKDRVLFI
ncbi:hypothetical protein K5549_020541, partial [Capra hircus]|uniref:Uncharacterized protein n=1 Tax=Capra hircus TaxID=9925 RepID=A0A452E2F4_CAPHI